MVETDSTQARPLSLIKPGEVVRLLSVVGGGNLRTRLAAMGLVPGTMLEVVRNNSHGPVIVSVKGSRLMLGRGMSHKIMVA